MLESHRRQIAIVFCDLRGFTPFSEVAEPEEVMHILHEYHQAMGAVIAHYQGTVEHFAGDGLMVFFNDPLPCRDPAQRAASMSLAMRDRMADLSQDWRRRGYQLGFGVGVTLGFATLGVIGFEDRSHYGAIGSVVNLASRLCDEAKDGQILISQRVAATLNGLAEVDRLPALTLKGFAHPVPAFCLVGMRSESDAEEVAAAT
jgi:class 3 adenylate cyclase